MVKNNLVVRKGAWTEEEDSLLRNCIEKFGEGKWHKVPLRAGLNRCRKSCRLRWLNYLRPNLKKGYFNKDETDLVLRLHKLLGNRWVLIAGRLPGRTANDVKNFWNTHILKKSKSLSSLKNSEQTAETKTLIIKPRPRVFSKSIFSSEEDNKTDDTKQEHGTNTKPYSFASLSQDDERNYNSAEFSLSIDECIKWWLETSGDDGDEPLVTQPLFSPREINQKIMEFTSLVAD